MGSTLSTKKALKDTPGMTTSITKLEKKIKNLKSANQSIIASHIWWGLCGSHSRDEMAGIKSMINYNNPHNGHEVVENALIEFGFSVDYAEAAIQSQLTLKTIKNEN